MRRDFVASRRDFPHERAEPLGDPAEDEERRAHARPVEQLEQPLRVRHDAALEPSQPARDTTRSNAETWK